MIIRENSLAGKIILPIFMFLSGTLFLSAQQQNIAELSGFREQSVNLQIISRIIDENQNVAWYTENNNITLPGRPVGIQLIGSNIIVVIQFTPFLRSRGPHLLLAQAQIWIHIPNEGISYHTTIQTIPLEFSEIVYFFPLGQGTQVLSSEGQIDPPSYDGTSPAEALSSETLSLDPSPHGTSHDDTALDIPSFIVIQLSLEPNLDENNE